MEISQYTWSRQTVVLSGRDGSVSNRSPQWSFYANRIRSDESHCKPGCSQLDVEEALSNVFESNAAGVTNFSIQFEGHCALTNADEANEVQQNVVTVKKGKKRGIKAILHRSR